MKRRIVNISATMAAAVLLVAACSDSGSPEDAGPGSSSQGALPPGEPIKIGMLNPEGGAFYNEPDFLAATKAAFRDINGAGGINGRPLELDWCNESNDANKAAACVRSFVEHGVVATVNNCTVTNPEAGVSVLGDAQIAGINQTALAPVELAAPNYFPFDGLSPFENAAAAGFAVSELGLKKIAIVRNDTPQAESSEAVIRKAVESQGGTIVERVLIPTTPVADWAPYAQQIASSGAEAVNVALPENSSISMAKEIRSLGGTDIVFIGIAGRSDDQLSENAAVWDGSYFASPNPWVNDAADYPLVNDFLASLKAEEDAGNEDAAVGKLRPLAFRAWLAVHMLADVLGQMDAEGTEITAPNVLAAFKAAELDTGLGFTWTPGKPLQVLDGFENTSNAREFILSYKDGKQELYQKDPVDAAAYLE